MSAIAYIFATAVALAVYGALQVGIVSLYGLAGRFPCVGGVSVFQLFAALLNWSSCIFSVLAGLGVSPRLREKNRALFAGLLSFVIGVFQLGCAIAVFNYASAIGGQIVPLSIIYYGGVLALCAVACLVYELVSVKGDLAQSRAMRELSKPSVLTSAYLPASRGAFRRAMAEKLSMHPEIALDGESAYFDFDLILLEESLLKMKPDRDSYLSALRFGITIEKDTGYRNCRARNFTFAQIIKDVSLRLAAAEPENVIFQELSCHLQDYGELATDERIRLIQRFEECLPLEAIEKTVITQAVDSVDENNLVGFTA